MKRAIICLGLFSFFFSGSALLMLAGWDLAQDQAKPPLDISGIAEIQKIPIGKDKIFIKGDKKNTPAEKVLESLANLAVMQFDVEDKKFNIKIKDPVTGKEEEIIGGEFGRILRKEILGINPKRERLRVEHTELVQTPGLTPKFDEDKYELWINAREIELILARDFGRPDKGFPEWGVLTLHLKQYIKDGSNPPKTEELVLGIDKDEAIYTRRILAPNGKLLQWWQWKFVPGNPNPTASTSGNGS